MKRTIIDIILILAMVTAFVLLVGGCKPGQLVTMPEYHYVTTHDTITAHDSIWIYLREYIKGDTIHKDSIVYRDRWRDRIVEVHTSDTVPVPVEVIKEVAVRSGYDKFCSAAFWIIVACVLVYIAVRVIIAIYFRK